MGGTVTWTNKDPVPHTVTARDGTWGSKLIEQGKQYSYTFTKEGVYDFYCMPHPWMIGRIVVGNPPQIPATSQSDNTSTLDWMRQHMDSVHGAGSFDAMRQWMDKTFGPGTFDSMPCHQVAPAANISTQPGPGTRGATWGRWPGGMMGGGGMGMMGGRGGMMGW